MVLKIEPLDNRRHNRTAFGCGQDSLDNYIQKQASQDFNKRVAAVFVLLEAASTEIIAYYTLSSYTIELGELNETAKRLPRYPVLPATLLGRLAVDSSYQGQRFGELILLDALKKALEATVQVASFTGVVEALDEKAVSFYQRYGFYQFKKHPMKLYLPMKSIESLCKAFSI